MLADVGTEIGTYPTSRAPLAGACNWTLIVNITQTATDHLAARGIEAVLSTADAAVALNRQPQTLRKWACLENGPIRPVRINGRLAWRVADIAALLRGHAPVTAQTWMGGIHAQ
jgi:hypothetical protein